MTTATTARLNRAPQARVIGWTRVGKDEAEQVLASDDRAIDTVCAFETPAAEIREVRDTGTGME